MTDPSTPTSRVSWQYVALAAIGAGFFLGIFVLIPDDQPQMRTGLLGFLFLAGQAAVAHFLGNRVKEVKSQVNGRMTDVLTQLEQANTRLNDHHVSRETSPGEGDQK